MNVFAHLSRDHTYILLLVTVTIIVRILSFAYFSSITAENPIAEPYPIVSGDSEHYAKLGNNLLTRHAYEEVPGVPFRSWPPGYPALLAGVMAMTGSMTGVVVIQTLLSALAVALIYLMARTMVPTVYAALPAFIYAIDPMVVFSDTAIRTDGIFTSLLVLAIYIAFWEKRLGAIVRWGLSGFLLGIATMIRPIAEFLVIVLPVVYLFNAWRSGSDEPARFKAAGVFVAACVVVLLPWMLYNQKQFGSFEVSNLGGHNLLLYDVRGFLAWRELAKTDPMPAILVLRHVNDPVFTSVDKRIASDLKKLTPAGEDPENYEGTLAISYIVNDPFRYTYFHFVNTIPFFLSSSVATYVQYIHQQRDNEGFYAPVMASLVDAWARIRHPENPASLFRTIWSVLPITLEVVAWLLACILGLFALYVRRKEGVIILCAVLVMYFAALTGPMSMSRYRIPAEPYLLLLATVGTYALVQRVRDAYAHVSRRANSPATADMLSEM